MMPLSYIPQDYNQNPAVQFLQQILQQRKQAGMMDSNGSPAPAQNVAALPNPAIPQNGSMQGIQAISQLLGYKPGTTFGYDTNNQNMFSLLSSIFGGGNGQ